MENRLPATALNGTVENDRSYIAGNTLRTYWYILMNNHDCGVREVQRALNFSSSSTAYYHLEKLVDKGLLLKDARGNYRLNSKAKVGLIDPYIIVHGFVFPKQLAYAAAITSMCFFYVAFFWSFLSLAVMFALLPGIVACVISWYEALRLWSSLPKFA